MIPDPIQINNKFRKRRRKEKLLKTHKKVKNTIIFKNKLYQFAEAVLVSNFFLSEISISHCFKWSVGSTNMTDRQTDKGQKTISCV